MKLQQILEKSQPSAMNVASLEMNRNWMKLDLFACPINVSRVHKELLLGMLSPILTWTMSGLPSGMGWILTTKDRRLVPDFVGHMNSSKHGAYGAS